jgi:hypothetical protein
VNELEHVELGPWRPGIVSPVPDRLLHLCTVFRPENVFTSPAEARELRGYTGLAMTDLVAFRPERLALHELLLRVTADFSVPDGERIEDLGINFRRITSDILTHHLTPRREAIAAHYARIREALSRRLASEAGALFAPQSSATTQSLVAHWREHAHAAGDPVQRGAYGALAKGVSAVLARHGRLWGTPELMGSVALNLACNECGSEEIGRLIEPWLMQAARERGYALLPRQDTPVVMNTKGASASGKSTLRPLQRRLAADIGTSWRDYALISPDIWRKQLLDYGSLGADYKYAGAFTGDELRIVDQRLDRYMAAKATRGEMSHLLIDRFRFDSFAPDSEVAGSNLLTRFGSVVYLFFMITPPAELVERAWRRGLEVGRYKAVDDTLAHAVEAYAGMPELFFTWVEHAEKRVHFEFLDNSVPLGEPPRTVAFGWNESITILDVKSMLDVVRFRQIDINATSTDRLFRDGQELAPERNTAFLRACVQRFPDVTFADHATGRAYLRLKSGLAVWRDRTALERACFDGEAAAGLHAAAPGAFAGSFEANRPHESAQVHLLSECEEHRHTVGRWGRT